MFHHTATSNIPIPAAAPTRNIEDVISIPFVVSPGPLGRSHLSPQSLSHIAPGPNRSFPRSVSGSYEPRIIRASPSHNTDTSCISTSPALPASRHRRPSGSTTLVPANSSRNPSSSRTIFNPSPPIVPSSIISFPRPAYLEHSALRHLLQTETPSGLPPNRYKPETTTSELANTTANAYPYFRRERTPLIDSDDEGSLSPPREVAPSVPTTTPISLNPVLRLPTRWSDHDRYASLSVSPDGRELTFVGASSAGDKEAAAARTNYSIPPACGIYYYEVEILNKGQKGYISIGLSGPDVRLSRLPGWEKHSWGYHGDDGLSFAAERTGSPYGPTYTTGDVIGCGIDFTQNRAFYTKNGALLGPVFDNVGKECDLYPSIGLRHQGESIRVNFGHDPFQYDIEDHVHQQRNQVWTNIQRTPLDWNALQRITEDGGSDPSFGLDPYTGAKNVSIASMTNNDIGGSNTSESSMEDWGPVGKKTKITIDKLVSSYLIHHGYAKTASALKAQSESEYSDKSGNPSASFLPCFASNPRSDDIDLRTRIVRAVAKGNVDTALEDTAVNYPVVLEKEQGLMLFKLRCRKFIELLLEAAEALKWVKKEEQVEEIAREVAFRRRGRGTHTSDADGNLGLDGMDVDDDAFRPSYHTNGFTKPAEDGTKPSGKRRPSAASTNAAQNALNEALSYGQQLEADYKSDLRPEMRTYLKRTFSVVAYEDPLAVGGEVNEIAGQESRELLATELNQAILESQGKPTRPALEILFRQTSACLGQLGLMGVGAAVFADVQAEFFDA